MEIPTMERMAISLLAMHLKNWRNARGLEKKNLEKRKWNIWLERVNDHRLSRGEYPVEELWEIRRLIEGY